MSTPGRSSSKYDGGFHSSICGLFDDSSRRNDCCALVCCGTLASDRTNFLLNNEMPTPWWIRIGINVVFPLLVYLGGHTLAITIDPDPSTTDSDENVIYYYVDYMTNMLTFAIVMALLVRATIIRIRMRRKVMNIMRVREYGVTSPSGPEETPDSNSLRVHYPCWIALKDNTMSSDEVVSLDRDVNYDASGDIFDEDKGGPRYSDLCTVLWSICSFCCCGCAGFWCQCFGMCAIGQEAREVRRLLPTYEQLRDYVTFESYSEYYPKINELRRNDILNFFAHAKATSQLSKRICLYFLATLLIFLLLGSPLGANSLRRDTFTAIVVTLIQSFFSLFAVHWLFHRFDLSLDAVIKYFASGFFLCPLISTVYELVVGGFMFAFAYFFLVAEFDLDGNKFGETWNDSGVSKDFRDRFLQEHTIAFVLIMAVEAFVIAGLIEEVSKYFAYRMVDHPDWITRQSLASIARPPTNETGQSPSPITNFLEGVREEPQTSMRKAASITVAMVSVALGFTCSKQLIHILIFRPPNFALQKEELLIRALLPIHPIAAAVQSVGVCRRDLEHDHSHTLGHIVFPAIMLTGSYDFILGLVNLVFNLRRADGQAENDHTPYITVSSIAVAVIVSMAFVFFMVMSKAQRRRLVDMDASRIEPVLS